VSSEAIWCIFKVEDLLGVNVLFSLSSISFLENWYYIGIFQSVGSVPESNDC